MPSSVHAPPSILSPSPMVGSTAVTVGCRRCRCWLDCVRRIRGIPVLLCTRPFIFHSIVRGSPQTGYLSVCCTSCHGCVCGRSPSLMATRAKLPPVAGAPTSRSNGTRPGPNGKLFARHLFPQDESITAYFGHVRRATR